MFRVGQKVVCVNASPPNQTGYAGRMHGLTEGRVYTVRWVGMHRDRLNPEDTLCVKLAEIPTRPNPHAGADQDVPYLAIRFRPVVEVEKKEHAGMEVLRRIAADPKVPIKEDA